MWVYHQQEGIHHPQAPVSPFGDGAKGVGLPLLGYTLGGVLDPS